MGIKLKTRIGKTFDGQCKPDRVLSYDAVENALNEQGYCIVRGVSKAKVSSIKGVLAEKGVNTRVVRLIPANTALHTENALKVKYPNSYKIIKEQS